MLNICFSSSATAVASCPYWQITRHSCTSLPSWPMLKASSTGPSSATYMGCMHSTLTWACHIHSKGPQDYTKCLRAIHIQSNQESHKMAFTYDLLVLAGPLHQFSAQQVLWAALTMAHFSLLHTGEFTVDQEQFNPTHHLCIQEVTPILTAQSELRYVTIHLKTSKTDPFGQGMDVIIGCSGTQVCGACAAWDLIQSHQVKQASHAAPFFQLSGWPLSRDMMVGHIKGLLAKLGLNPSSYSRHSLHTGGVNTATTVSLRDWEIKSLGCWKSNTYWMYIREMTGMKANCARRMAHAPASRAFNYSHPYPVKDKL